MILSPDLKLFSNKDVVFYCLSHAILFIFIEAQEITAFLMDLLI
jgi:hypothetical protein